eukprot:4704399-Ditylum_brightwellii.AAC.1
MQLCRKHGSPKGISSKEEIFQCKGGGGLLVDGKITVVMCLYKKPGSLKDTFFKEEIFQCKGVVKPASSEDISVKEEILQSKGGGGLLFDGDDCQ